MKSVLLHKRNSHRVIPFSIVASTGLLLIWTLALCLINLTNAQSKMQNVAGAKEVIGQKVISLKGSRFGYSILVSEFIYFSAENTGCLTGLSLFVLSLDNRFCLLNCLKLMNSKTQKYNNQVFERYPESWILNYLFVRGP